MMTLKSIIVTVSVLCALRMLTACETVEMVFYDHEPSETFYHEFDIGAVYLEPFIDSEICFTVDLKATDHRNQYIVWLGLDTFKKNKEVKVKKAIIQGGSWKEEYILDKTVMIEDVYDERTQRVLLGKVIAPLNLLRESVELFQIKSSVLKTAYQEGGHLRLKVFYEVEGKDGFKQYELKQRIERHTVFPT